MTVLRILRLHSDLADADRLSDRYAADALRYVIGRVLDEVLRVWSDVRRRSVVQPEAS